MKSGLLEIILTKKVMLLYRLIEFLIGPKDRKK